MPIFTSIVRTLSASRSKSIRRRLGPQCGFEYDTLERVLRLHEEAAEELGGIA